LAAEVEVSYLERLPTARLRESAGGENIVTARRLRRGGSNEAIEVARADRRECKRAAELLAADTFLPRYSLSCWRRRPSFKRSWLC
jgi:hypothetical protein